MSANHEPINVKNTLTVAQRVIRIQTQPANVLAQGIVDLQDDLAKEKARSQGLQATVLRNEHERRLVGQKIRSIRVLAVDWETRAEEMEAQAGVSEGRANDMEARAAQAEARADAIQAWADEAGARYNDMEARAGQLEAVIGTANARATDFEMEANALAMELEEVKTSERKKFSELEEELESVKNAEQERFDKLGDHTLAVLDGFYNLLNVVKTFATANHFEFLLRQVGAGARTPHATVEGMKKLLEDRGVRDPRGRPSLPVIRDGQEDGI